MKKHLGGTLFMVSALFAGAAGADDTRVYSADEIRRAEEVLAAAAKYGRACPRFFGEGGPVQIGRFYGDGRTASGERRTRPTTAGSIGWRMRSSKDLQPSRTAEILPPVSIGRRLDGPGENIDVSQFCRVGTPTYGRWFNEARSGGVKVAPPKAATPKTARTKPYQYRPVTYKPYGLP